MRKIHKDFSQSGFTLIELLIVIVIIGILAGVVIGVINPAQQQARAKDAVIRSQLDKMALSNKSLFYSSGRTANESPTGQEFINGMSAVVNAAACNVLNNPAVAGSTNCAFQIAGVPTAAAPATFTYVRDTGNSFRVGAPGLSVPVMEYVFYYSDVAGTVTEGFWSCSTTVAPIYNILTTVPSVAAGCTAL